MVKCHNEMSVWLHWLHLLSNSGKNASGQTHYLSISGFEVYGTVTGVIDDLGKVRELDALSKKSVMKSLAARPEFVILFPFQTKASGAPKSRHTVEFGFPGNPWA